MKQRKRSIDLPEILFRLQNHISREFKVLIRYFFHSHPWLIVKIHQFGRFKPSWLFQLEFFFKTHWEKGEFFFSFRKLKKEGRPLRRGLFEFAFAPRCLKLGFVVVILTLKVAENLNVRQPSERLPFWKAIPFGPKFGNFFHAKIMVKHEGSCREIRNQSLSGWSLARLTWLTPHLSGCIFQHLLDCNILRPELQQNMFKESGNCWLTHATSPKQK